MNFYLFQDPSSQNLEASASIPLSQVTSPGTTFFSFSALPGSSQEDYYFTIHLEGDGSVQAGAAPGNTYLNGALYKEDTSQDAQLAFQLKYAPHLALAGLVKEGLSWLGVFLVSLFVYVVPGWALLSWLYSQWVGLGWGEKLGLGVGAEASRLLALLRGAHGPAWREAQAGHLNLGQLKVMSAVERCRTAVLGGHVLRCEA